MINSIITRRFRISELDPRSRKTSGEKLAAGIGILAGGIIGGLISGLGNSSPGNVTKPKPKQNAGTHSISVSVNPAQSTVSQNILKHYNFSEIKSIFWRIFLKWG